VDADPRYANFFPGVIPTRSELSVPIRMGEEIVGVLDVQSRQLNAFDENDVMVMETLADQIAVTVENARLFERAQREIAERKRAEEALRESEEKYRGVVERASDGITIIQDKILKYVNPRLAEMRGDTVERILGTPFTDYVHPEALPEVIDRYKRRMAGEKVAQVYETTLRRKDGSKVYAELNAGMITYQGEPADLVIVRDITERVRAREELERRL
jgi:PAS domain S-box-containing protein